MSRGIWNIGTSITHGAIGATGPQGPLPGFAEWRFRPEKPGRYEHQLTGKRQFCVRVMVMHYGRAVPALATRIHRNTREFVWRERDRKSRMATLEHGAQGTCQVADEGTTWCWGWKSEDQKALQAASALANT